MSDPTLLAPIAKALTVLEPEFKNERIRATVIARSIRANPATHTALYLAMFPDPPPCAVCGGRLSIASMGGGELTEYACQSDDARKSLYETVGTGRLGEDHYSRSKWTERRPNVADILTELLGPEP